MITWKHLKTITDGEPFSMQGLDIWSHAWKDTGVKIPIKDPMYSQDYNFSVFEITDGQTTVNFAAGEFSNSVWGIYVEREALS